MCESGDVGVDDVRRWVRMLSAAGGPADAAERIDLIRGLERLVYAAAGLQAQVAADFDRAEGVEAVAAGVPEDRRGRRIAAQIGLARREFPHRVDRVVMAGVADAARSRPTESVAVNVVVSDRALFGDCSDPAFVDGYGPVSADLARDLVHRAGSAGLARLRKVYSVPESGAVVTMDRRTRLFPKDLASLIRIRDRTCRTPYCDAPIRHIDHIRPAADGGAMSLANGQGFCVACNHATQGRNWHARGRIGPSGRHGSVITTPTGHRYSGEAPPVANPAALQSFSKPRSMAG